MRGYPPIHLFFLILAFAGMAVPLVRLTRARPLAAAVPKSVRPATMHSTHLKLRYAHTPKSISLKTGARDLLKDISVAASPVELQADLDIPAEGIEFILTCEWAAGTADTPLTLELEPDGLDTKTETRWSSGHQMTEVISFQWK